MNDSDLYSIDLNVFSSFLIHLQEPRKGILKDANVISPKKLSSFHTIYYEIGYQKWLTAYSSD